ncbi:pilus assembly protein [Nitrincola iocasae]|uniref:PA14 domain-containing protein n=1 Tax=Nitrincola iocasae TaxID=2614693 RepID=A0A5J6LA49_9GAMM|nr:PilC/PilY family type IV pilus protein [Nitrincola iocasae]QEW05256.1 hypothetical protein F5I99_01400 [Nitrincola iocasae]
MTTYQTIKKMLSKTAFILITLIVSSHVTADVDISPVPLSVRGEAVPPLNMIVMGRDHTLYYEAYNDASDLNGDGELNIGYEPEKVDYYGYFDSTLCYSYTNNQFKAAAEAANKTCSSGWSGDFLNYITTARIDALRKVLYGGNRITDTETQTVLERSYIPQDAHSWGKEYRSIEHDGYDIRNYTPLGLPASGTRHLFANTTLLKNDVLTPYKSANMEPLMRVLTNSRFRIWEWVAIERHVAGSRCIHGGNNNNPCVYNAADLPTSNADSHQEFLQMRVELTDFECGSDYIADGNIDTTGSDNNPFTVASDCGHDYYLTNITGQFRAQQTGTYQFAANGDDAVEFEINGEVVSYWYGGHGRKSGSTANQIAQALIDDANAHIGQIELNQGWHNFTFRHEEQTGGDNWQLLVKRPGQTNWEVVPSSLLRASETDTSQGPVITTWTKEATVPASRMTDYAVRVEVCGTEFQEENCQQYPEGNYKPVGLLQDFGKNDQMLFGLITGSYTHPYNMRGGLLRKNIDSISDEIDSATGAFTTTSGIIDTISKLRVVDFDAGSNFQYNGGWLTDKPMSDSNTKFPDWGNPIAEMLYESLRYFTGEETATSQFSPTLDNKREKVTLRHYSGTNHMFLPAPDWIDPYEDRLWCTPSAQLIISDVNPSYDTEFLPGSNFNSSFSGDLPSGVSLNVTTEADAVWSKEYGSNGLHFIGESGSLSDGVPTAKTVTGFGNIRGLSPAEPTKEGGYYSAAITHFAYNNDLRTDLPNTQNINTFSVALASPLPKIEIPVDNKIVTIIPFGKSVGQDSSSWASRSFQPTNTIVDFFVEKFESDHYIFRINFEDVEQGADHDMDAIVRYDIKVNSDNTITVTLDSEYAAGGIIHHMGYVISGTDKDGVYLEVRDRATSAGNDPWFPMDTPVGFEIGDCYGASRPSACSEKPSLPLLATRTFTPSSTSTATLLNDPLWYAAKYGSAGSEELSTGETSPNYFLVTNASNLKQQLTSAFEAILVLGEPSTTAAAVSSGSLRTGTLAYTAGFRPEDWSGQLKAFELNTDGTVGSMVWDAESKLRAMIQANLSRNIFTTKTVDDAQTAVEFEFDQLSATQQGALNKDLSNVADGLGSERVSWLRGDDSAHSTFRSREAPGGQRLLGSIINSDPQFMGKPNFGFSLLPVDASSSYKSFRNSTTYTARPDVLFVGTNSGFVHAFNATSDTTDGGKELFAYIPQELIEPESTTGSAAKVNRLMDTEYVDKHQYMVDGTVAVTDAYFQAPGESAAKWRTIAVGSMGAGGKSIFALDVSDPENFSASDVLWEFNDVDLGYGVTHPQLGCIVTGTACRWVAIFGNGYNSASNRAILYIVDLKDGTLIEKLDTSIGSAASPNGMAPASISDWPNNDLAINHVFAGDLQGNVWKFDLSGNQNQWKNNIDKVFTATDPDGLAQPITSQILIAAKPNTNSTMMLLFGTGSYFRNTDGDTDYQVQTLYGLEQTTSSNTTILKNQLLEQEITWINSAGGYQSTSTNSVGATQVYKGWYLNLAVNDVSDGERVINKPTIIPGIRRDRVLFTSMAPATDPCIGGVEGRYTDLMIGTGDRNTSSVFDLNQDGKIDAGDIVDGEVVSRVTGSSHTGESATIVTDEEGRAFALEGGLEEDEDLTEILGTGQQFGRQSWQQLR